MTCDLGARRRAAQAACLLLLSCLATPARAQQATQQREAAIFGRISGEPEQPSPPQQTTEGEDPEEKTSREAEIFGPTPTTEAPDEPEPDEPTAPPSVLVDPQSVEGEQELLDKLERADDELALGGFLFSQLNYAIPDGGDFEGHSLSSPNLLDLYLDARPNDRVRAYIQGRLQYTPSTPMPGGATTIGALNEEQMGQMGGDLEAGTDQQTTLPLGLVGAAGTGQQLQVQLDQLWVKFDIARQVFVTFGRQPIRWGAARFWNPTDFLNAQQINPIVLFDQRLGVDLLKLHVPLEKLGWNLYAIAALGEANTLDDIGGALRAEMLLFDRAELALSFAARRQIEQGPSPITAPPPLDVTIYEPEQQWPQTSVPLRFGADLSTSLGPFELRLEGALTRGLARPFYRGDFVLDFQDITALSFPEDYSRQQEWVPQLVASTDVKIDYGNSDTLIVAAEYFFNDAGYEDSDLLLWLALQGGLQPLYLGRHYAAIAAILPSPGNWERSSITLSTLGNLSDRSFLTRLDYGINVLTDLNLNVFLNYHYGANGEFHYSIEIPPGFGQEEATVIPAPRLSLGGALRLSF